jgi:formiminotetrahydrofolate cyclodeaminase
VNESPRLYASESLRVYLDDAASNAPAPGGGSVSACVGALGAALVSMVCNLTRGREAFVAVEGEIQALVVRSEEARARLEQLLQDDTVAYNAVVDAYRMPKGTEGEQAARSAAIQAGLRIAADVPLEICRVAVEVCRLSKTAARLGNPQAVTDAGIGAVLGEAAAVGASLNVLINLGSMKDKVCVDSATAEVDALLVEAAALRAEVLDITRSRL